MDGFDVVVLLVALVAAVGGYRLGFFTRVLSWLGLALGAYLAIHFLPRIITAADLSGAGARLFVAVAILVVGAFAGQALGMLVGSRLHAVLPGAPLRRLDNLVGAAVGVVGVGLALWLLLPAISSVAGWPARATRHSVIARWLSASLPQPPNALESLQRLVAADGFPQVFATLHPDRAAGAPPGADPLSTAVTRRVEASSVEVVGQACGRIQEGSGFAVAPDLVLTNAHVVAGEPPGETSVLLPSGTRRAAAVVRYDPDRDVALLRVPGLAEFPLALTTGAVGEPGAVFGHPGGQVPIAVQPAVVAREITAVGEDLYDRHTTARDVYVLGADLRPGDSGGAVVDRSGRVIGVAFAIAVDASHTAYALTTAEVRPDLRGAPGRAVSTEACTAG
ncbi:MAG TPA: MarP family serine protease [Acidimicrobiales bacterium]|nr:MarP family serine protease [Acidimicrobiales bacterium]